MTPSQIRVGRGKLVSQLKGSISQLAKLLGRMGIASISGAVEAKQTEDGLVLYFPPKMSEPNRCYVASGSTPTALPANLNLSSITYDVADTFTDSIFATLSSNVVTLTKPGLYLVTYHASLELDLAGATSHIGANVLGSTVLRAGGVDITATGGVVSAMQVPDFGGFVKLDDETEPLLTQVDVGGATGKTDAFSTTSFVTCSPALVIESGEIVYSCANGLDDTTLDVNGKQAVTLDSSQVLDATDNYGGITAYTPSGQANGCTSGTALIKVIRNSSGVIKILDGVTERNPTLSIYGDRSTGSTVDALNCTLSILKL